jgi:curli production assembly/transport component CsgG
MRSRGWITVWCAAAVLGQAVPSSARGVKDILHRGPKNQEQVRSCVQRRALMAYFQDDKGSMSPVRNTLNTDHDKDWMGLHFTDYDGPRIRLGVLKVINKSAESEERSNSDQIAVPLSGIQEMLTVALYNTKRFDVIEQKRIEEVKAQQTRKDVAEPSPTSIVNIGKVLGAQYLVYGTVNEWNPERSQKSMSPRDLLHLNLNGGKKDAEVAITFTLTDVANGQNPLHHGAESPDGRMEHRFVSSGERRKD